MFGNYNRSLDDKNRVMIPTKIRKELSGVVYASVGPDNILELRDKSSFETWKNKILEGNSLNRNMRAYARVVLGNTFEINVDKQSRINIPDAALQKANITKEITFVGVGNKVEIWPTDAYESFQNKFGKEDSIDSLSEKLLNDGVEL